MNFTKKQALELEELLDEKEFPEVLNYRECHGFLCGIAAGPISLECEEIINNIYFGEEEPSPNIPTRASELINTLFQQIENTFFSAETLLLPCSLQLENGKVNESLEDWALGFFEAHLLNEDAWYSDDEVLAAEMLIPILLCLEDIDDEGIDKIKENEELFQTLLMQIPQALQDLYLFFHVNDS